jgi:hypothetical protein
MSREKATTSISGCTVAIFCLCLIFAAVVFGVEPVQFPAFSVQGMDGSASNTSTWTLQSKWVVVYVEGRSDPLLRRLSQPEFSQVAVRTIIIVGGLQLQDAQAVQKKFPQLASASWFVDSPKNAVGALGLEGAPIMIGVQDKTLRWRVNGFPHDPKFLQSLLTRWIAQ